MPGVLQHAHKFAGPLKNATFFLVYIYIYMCITVAAKAWPWRALPFRGLCPKQTGRRAHVSSRQSQEYVATYLKIRRVARPDDVTPRTAHPPSPLQRVLPPMRLFWQASRPFCEFDKVFSSSCRICFYPHLHGAATAHPGRKGAQSFPRWCAAPHCVCCDWGARCLSFCCLIQVSVTPHIPSPTPCAVYTRLANTACVSADAKHRCAWPSAVFGTGPRATPDVACHSRGIAYHTAALPDITCHSHDTAPRADTPVAQHAHEPHTVMSRTRLCCYYQTHFYRLTLF